MVQVKLSSKRKDSSGRLTGVVWNKGKSKTLNDMVLAYTEKQVASEKKNNHVSLVQEIPLSKQIIPLHGLLLPQTRSPSTPYCLIRL